LFKMKKWQTGVSPSDRAVDVAERALADRLKAVLRYLRRAVKRPNEPENVHQLRVWSRRSEAALTLYADLLPRRLFKRVQRMARQARRAAGRARDCDVFAPQVTGPDGKWPPGLKRERVQAQRELVALFDRLDSGRMLKKSTKKLLKRMQERNENSHETLAERARDSLRPIVFSFFDTFPGPIGDDELHRFRIIGKDLRYALELLAGAFPASMREDIYPVLSNLQEKLGRINDLVVARERFREELETRHDPAELSDLRRKLSAAEEELSRLRDGFHRWWTPELSQSLRGRFEDLLKPPGGSL
jgi:CHAD domain-containing protein